MDDLARWLGQQLDIDAAGVEAATWADDATTWHAAPSPYDTWGKSERWYVEDSMEEGVITHVDPKAAQDEGVARHIAAWDPARVLREIDAKRMIVAAHERRPMPKGDSADCAHCWGAVWPCPTLRILASVYDDRPGFKEEWRP